MNYRYRLSRSPKKYICPNCHKKTFTPYVSEDGNPVDVEIYGRCDRENNCQYNVYPKGADYVPSLDDLTARTPKPKVITYLDWKHVERTENKQALNDNTLFQFLTGVFGADVVLHVWELYRVGTNNKDHTFSCFWQIDQDGNVRTGHFIQYTTNGHRNKSNVYSQTWAHSLLKRAKLLDDGAEVEQCLFGEHLLADNDKDVYLFESEKTALIASMIHHDAVCVACSGGDGFTSSKLQSLKDRNVLYFADDDAKGRTWDEKAQHLKAICNIKSLTNARWVDGIPYEYTANAGWDYGDHILYLMQSADVEEYATEKRAINEQQAKQEQTPPERRNTAEATTTDGEHLLAKYPSDKFPFYPIESEAPF